MRNNNRRRKSKMKKIRDGRKDYEERARKNEEFISFHLFKDAEAMYRLITINGESLIVRDIERSSLRTIKGIIPAFVWRDRAKLGVISRIASTKA